MRLIANKEQQTDVAHCRNGQSNVFDAKAFGQLGHESVDRESDDKEQIDIDERECGACGISRVACKFAEPQPEGAIVGDHGCWSDVMQSLYKMIFFINKNTF